MATKHSVGFAVKAKSAALTAHDRLRPPPEAYADLDEIWEFIATDSLDAADRVREEILTSIRGLVPFPQQGHRRPDLTSLPLRFQTVREYLIAYAPAESPLLVVAILHGRRNPRVMAAILRGRE
jgi:plasmid stabilization system protein ParE